MSSGLYEFAYTLVPTAGGGYEVPIYEDGKYISKRWFSDISEATDWGTNYCYELNRRDGE